MIKRLTVGFLWLIVFAVGAVFVLGFILAIAESTHLIEPGTAKAERYSGLVSLVASIAALVAAYRGMLPGTRRDSSTEDVPAPLAQAGVDRPATPLPEPGIARGLTGIVKGLLKATALVLLIVAFGLAGLLYYVLSPRDRTPQREAPDTPHPAALVALASGSKDPLWLALASNDPALVRDKLKEGADPNMVVKGKSLLWYALENKWATTALVLVENGADCSQFPQGEKPVYGRPLFAAARAGMQKVVKACFDRGAHNTFSEEDKLSMLTNLGIGSSPEMIRWAVSQGWTLDARYPDGRNILHVVLSSNDPKLENVRALVELGADLTAQDTRGRLPFEHFFAGGSQHLQWDHTTDVAIYLIEQGADIEPKDGSARFSVTGGAAFWAIPELVTVILRREWSADARQRRCAEIDAGSSDGIKAMIQGPYYQSDTRRGRRVSWKDLHDRTIAAAHAGGCTMPLTDAALANRPS